MVQDRFPVQAPYLKAYLGKLRYDAEIPKICCGGGYICQYDICGGLFENSPI